MEEDLNDLKDGEGKNLKLNPIFLVAHMMRTPLSGIKWTLDMMLNGEFGPLNDEQRSYLNKVYDSSNRTINLVDDMLEANRLESGEVQYSFASQNLSTIVDEVIEEFTPKARRKNIKVLFVNKEEKFPDVLADSVKVKTLLENLLDNSMKYTPEGGVIKVELKQADKFMEVSIEDDGMGIPASDSQNIFKKFFRAQNALRVESSGSGLGLFVAKIIVDKHGGSIWFESPIGGGERAGGTVFHFTIPINN